MESTNQSSVNNEDIEMIPEPELVLVIGNKTMHLPSPDIYVNTPPAYSTQNTNKEDLLKILNEVVAENQLLKERVGELERILIHTILGQMEHQVKTKNERNLNNEEAALEECIGEGDTIQAIKIEKNTDHTNDLIYQMDQLVKQYDKSHENHDAHIVGNMAASESEENAEKSTAGGMCIRDNFDKLNDFLLNQGEHPLDDNMCESSNYLENDTAVKTLKEEILDTKVVSHEDEAKMVDNEAASEAEECVGKSTVDGGMSIMDTFDELDYQGKHPQEENVYESINYLENHCMTNAHQENILDAKVVKTTSQRKGRSEKIDGPIFDCSKCPAKFASFTELQHHRYDHEKGIFSCPKCSRKLKSKTYLAAHIMKHSEVKSFVCGQCERRFRRRRDLTQHEMIHNGEKPWLCQVCGRSFQTSYGLNTHVMVHTGEKPHQCNICQKSFSRISYLMTHKMSHSTLRPFKCTECDYSFARLTHLKAHKVTHSEMKPFVCAVMDCGRSFKQKCYLTSHMITHEGEKKLCCDQCNLAFYRNKDLVKHKITHLEIKPHPCMLCNKSFARARELGLHMMKHTGNRPYACDLCGVEFSTQQGYDRHMTTHTGSKLFRCNKCDKSFAHNHYLVAHQVVHTQQMTFACQKCERRFARRRNLKAHFEAIHEKHGRPRKKKQQISDIN